MPDALRSPAKLEAVLDSFSPAFARSLAKATLDRLGLERGDLAADIAFAGVVYDFMDKSRVPFEQFFFDWRGGPASLERAEASPAAEFYRAPAFEPRARRFAGAQARRFRQSGPPVFRGKPCTLLIDEIEALWAPIAAEDDWSGWHAKLNEIASAAEAYGVTTPSSLPRAAGPAHRREAANHAGAEAELLRSFAPHRDTVGELNPAERVHLRHDAVGELQLALRRFDHLDAVGHHDVVDPLDECRDPVGAANAAD